MKRIMATITKNSGVRNRAEVVSRTVGTISSAAAAADRFCLRSFSAWRQFSIVGLFAAMVVLVNYDAAADVYFGNQAYWAGTNNTYNLNGNQLGVSHRFTVEKGGTVIKILYYATTAGTNAALVGLQSDDGSNKPDNTFLTSTTDLPAGAGWRLVDTPDLAVNAGDQLHFVIKNNATAPGFRVRYTTGAGCPQMRSNDGSEDTFQGFLRTTDNGTTWTETANSFR